MTEELRFVLLLAGVLIFGYIIWDAKRRQKNDSKEKVTDGKLSDSVSTASTHPLESQQQKHDIDAEGYDDLGLTQVRVVNGPQPNLEQQADSTTLEQKLDSADKERVEPSFDDEPEQPQNSIEDPNDAEEDTIISSIADESIQDSSNLETMQKPETVITVNIMANSDSEFSGKNLLQEFLTLGFKYGDMGVFHRYQNANGQGERWFCLANAINPGSFDLDNMDDFTTPGLTLFMLLPGPQKPLEAFENMINAANKLQNTLGGKLEDGSHSALTQQRIQHYREEILNFQRQHLAKINHADDA